MPRKLDKPGWHCTQCDYYTPSITFYEHKFPDVINCPECDGELKLYALVESCQENST